MTTLCPWVSGYMGKGLMPYITARRFLMSAWAGVLPSPPPAQGPGAAILLKWCRENFPGLPVDPKQALVGHVALEEKHLNGAHEATQTEAPPTGPGKFIHHGPQGQENQTGQQGWRPRWPV